MKIKRENNLKPPGVSVTDDGRDHLGDLFHLLVESLLTAVYLIQDGLFRYVNQAFAEIFGSEV